MKTIFWNTDTQYDFMRFDEDFKGALAVPNARDIEEDLRKLTGFASGFGYKIVNTADWHTMESKEFSKTPDFVNTFPPHCLVETKGAEFVPATRPLHAYKIDWRNVDVDEEQIRNVQNLILYKDHFDIFQGNPHTEEILDAIRPETAIVYGVATNVCVDYAVKGLLKRGVKVIVPVDAIKELPGLPLEQVLKTWEEKGARLSTVDDVIREFGGN